MIDYVYIYIYIYICMYKITKECSLLLGSFTPVNDLQTTLVILYICFALSSEILSIVRNVSINLRYYNERENLNSVNFPAFSKKTTCNLCQICLFDSNTPITIKISSTFKMISTSYRWWSGSLCRSYRFAQSWIFRDFGRDFGLAFHKRPWVGRWAVFICVTFVLPRKVSRFVAGH